VTSAQEIVTFRDDTPPPGASPWVGGGGPTAQFDVVAPDPSWSQRHATIADSIRRQLGCGALALNHVGSTAVPGLVAKP
jgi:hypothetical protein